MRRTGLWLLLAAWAGGASAAPPQRIVTLAPNLAELVCAVGACDRLVGVSAYTNYPPQAASLPKVGDAYSVNLETVLAARPDLVLAWDQATPPATIARLRELGLRVEVPRIERLDDVAGALRHLGQELGTSTIADRKAADYRRRLAALRQRYADVPRVRVFFQLGTDPAYTINRKSSISAALSLCGGDNVFANMPRISGPVSAEAVLSAAPQAVFYGRTENRAAIRAYWARLRGVPAVKHHDLFAVDGDILARASPRMLDGVSTVCRRLDQVRRQLTAPAAE